jgi:hypothetical protein
MTVFSTQGGICNDRSDTGRLICCRCILFSAEYQLYLGKNRRESSSWGNATANLNAVKDY